MNERERDIANDGPSETCARLPSEPPPTPRDSDKLLPYGAPVLRELTDDEIDRLRRLGALDKPEEPESVIEGSESVEPKRNAGVDDGADE